MDVVLNVVLVLAIVVAVGGVAYGAVAESGSSGHTELFLATENENGSLVLDDYPSEFVRGQPRQLVAGLENREGEQQQYTVVVLLQRLEGEAVTEHRVLNRYDVTLANGERWTKPMSVDPTMTGRDLRLSYQVYLGAGPAHLREVEPDYEVYLRIDVSPSPRNA